MLNRYDYMYHCLLTGFVEALTSNLGQGGSLLVEHCGGELE